MLVGMVKMLWNGDTNGDNQGSEERSRRSTADYTTHRTITARHDNGSRCSIVCSADDIDYLHTTQPPWVEDGNQKKWYIP